MQAHINPRRASAARAELVLEVDLVRGRVRLRSGFELGLVRVR